MKFAVVNGQRQEAQPGLSGECQGCGSPVVAKCGEVRIWHWAHLTRRTCDVWWENETEWHRAWKALFPDSWQEIVHPAEDGMKHIADVKTDHGWVIEFQHSHIKPEERRSRDAFYKKLVWVVDATRLTRDAAQFAKALRAGTPVGGNPFLRQVRTEACRLLREWSGSPAPIFFDFGDEWLWWLLARRSDEPAYIARFPRMGFVVIHHGKGPEGARNFDEFTTSISALVRPQTPRQPPAQPLGVQQYVPRRFLRRRL
jgi:competence protein CoiA